MRDFLKGFLRRILVRLDNNFKALSMKFELKLNIVEITYLENFAKFGQKKTKYMAKHLE